MQVVEFLLECFHLGLVLLLQLFLLRFDVRGMVFSLLLVVVNGFLQELDFLVKKRFLLVELALAGHDMTLHLLLTLLALVHFEFVLFDHALA